MSERSVFFTVKDLTELFNVCPRTIHRWAKKGALEPRLQYRGGSCYRLIFPCGQVIDFLKKMPTPRDLDDPARAKTTNQIRRLRDLRSRLIGKTRARISSGKGQPRAVGIETEEEEPAIVDQRPTGDPRPPRGSKIQAEGERKDERSLWSSREDEEDERH